LAKVIFYEKPGCGGNARQKALLKRSGHQLDTRDLLTTAWTAAALRAFFGERPVAQWFNTASPRVKAGEVDPSALDADAALQVMLADPLLIRRPLIECDGRREVGFDTELIDAWIGLAPSPAPVGEGCPKDAGGEAGGCAVPTAEAAAPESEAASTFDARSQET
jgi:nitrogenase-associated protein